MSNNHSAASTKSNFAPGETLLYLGVPAVGTMVVHGFVEGRFLPVALGIGTTVAMMACVERVDGVACGVRYTFGRPGRGTVGTGLQLKMPWQEIRRVPLDIKTMVPEIEVSCPILDDDGEKTGRFQSATLKTFIQYAPDPNLFCEKGEFEGVMTWLVYGSDPAADAAEEVRADIAGIASHHSVNVLREYLPELKLYLECKFRLHEPPHRDVQSQGFLERYCSGKCPVPQEYLKWYREHFKQVLAWLSARSQGASPFEKRYGIKVSAVAVKGVEQAKEAEEADLMTRTVASEDTVIEHMIASAAKRGEVLSYIEARRLLLAKEGKLTAVAFTGLGNSGSSSAGDALIAAEGLRQAGNRGGK